MEIYEKVRKNEEKVSEEVTKKIYKERRWKSGRKLRKVTGSIDWKGMGSRDKRDRKQRKK